MIKPVTASLLRAIREGAELTPGCYVDFCLDTRDHFSALSACVWEGMTDEQELDAALGDEKKLTDIVQRHPQWKHLSFCTDWERLFDDAEIDEDDDYED